MTKQAMNHLLAGLERNGYLRREPASDDGRGTVIRLTDRGHDVQRIMQDGSRRLEVEWAAALADGTIEQLRELLGRLDAVVGAPP
jgi:DNA-binding MarR family transcriptional regulator